MRGRYVESLTWVEAEAALRARPTLLLPVGARTKEHGPHLPLDTDFRVAEYLARAFDAATVEQELRPDEVVIVRDGPVGPEITAELAAIRERAVVPVTLVELPENVGLARALEVGLARCAHEFHIASGILAENAPPELHGGEPLIHVVPGGLAHRFCRRAE